MRLSRLSTYWWLLGGGIALLAWLGVQQYRWIERASEAERQERRQFLRNALGGVRSELVDRLRKPLTVFRPDRGFSWGADLAALLASRFQQWQQDGGDPSLAAGLSFGWMDSEGKTRCLKMSGTDKGFSDSSWPPALDFYRADLERRSRREIGEMPFIRDGNTWGWNGSSLVLIFPVMDAPQPPGPPPAREGRLARSETSRMQFPPPPGRPGELRGWCFLEIRPQFLQNLLHELFLRYFGEAGLGSYKLALIGDRPAYQSIQAGAAWQPGDRADEAAPLFSLPRPERSPRPANGIESAGLREPPGSPPPEGGRLRYLPEPPDWRLVAQHREGSLDAVIRRNRRQSLLFGSSVLLLLLGSGILLVLSTHRARRLARQQMEFVAGISHELRTPLTVIRTTSYNLAQGKVGDPGRVQQYGEAIQKEVRRLTAHVERMLSFEGIESGRKLYELQAVDVAEVIARGYAEYAPIFESEGWQVEKEIEPDLPAVTADAQVLESLLKNLLENALKYAGKGRWLGIHAKSEITRGKTEVQIIVSDRGPGIEPDELPHIFEPFYRGRSRSAGPAASGVGLGLSLVQRHLREMDGRIDAQTAVGQGTVFTMHLPAVKTG